MTGGDRDVIIAVGLASAAVAAFVEPRVKDWCTRHRFRREVCRAHAAADAHQPDG